MENNKLIDSALAFAAKVQTNKYLDAMSKGLMNTLPITIIGSIALLLAVLPIAPYQAVITSIKPYFLRASTVTTSCLSIYAAYLIGYRLAGHFNTDQVPAGLIALFSFFILTPLNENGGLNMSYMGAQGLFTAIFASLISVRLYAALMQNKKLQISMPDSVPPMIARTFTTLIPVVLVGGLFIVTSWLFSMTPWGSFADMVYQVVASPLNSLGSSIWSLVTLILVQMILWFFGIHGSLVIQSVVQAVYLPMATANMEAFAAGVAQADLPNILGNSFYSIYAGIGGAGGTLSLLICILLFGKAKQYKELGKLSIVPGCFTINEPVVFGFPLIMNVITAVPFILVPIIQVLIPYFATKMGLVPPVTGIQVPFGMPVIISGFMAGGWQHALLQIIDIAVGVVIWLPFFKVADNQAYKEQLGCESEEALAGEASKLAVE